MAWGERDGGIQERSALVLEEVESGALWRDGRDGVCDGERRWAWEEVDGLPDGRCGRPRLAFEGICCMGGGLSPDPDPDPPAGLAGLDGTGSSSSTRTSKQQQRVRLVSFWGATSVRRRWLRRFLDASCESLISNTPRRSISVSTLVLGFTCCGLCGVWLAPWAATAGAWSLCCQQ